MNPIYTSNMKIRGPIVIQKILAELWLIGENHNITTTTCPTNKIWLDSWITFAKENKDVNIHFLTEISHHTFMERANTDSLQPISQICRAWKDRQLSSNIQIHDADGRFHAPFFPLEMLYNEVYYQFVMESFAMSKQSFDVSFLERQSMFAERFKEFEKKLYVEINTHKKARDFLIQLFTKQNIPSWYDDFIQFCNMPKPSYTLAQLPLTAPVMKWMSEYLKENIPSGVHSPIIEELQQNSSFNAARLPKAARHTKSKIYLLRIFAICLDIHMLTMYHNLKKHSKNTKDMYVFLTGYEHTKNILKLFSIGSQFVFSPNACIDMKNIEHGIIK